MILQPNGRLQESHDFLLEKHPKKRGICPQCKRPGEFRYFEGQSREFGICERKNECGYARFPTLEKQKDEDRILKIQVKKETVVYPDGKEILLIRNNKLSSFHEFTTKRLGLPPEHLDKWGVGTSKDDKHTVFILRNKDNKDLNCKFFEYNPLTCKKIGNPYYLPIPKNGKYGNCLYGEHLINDSPGKIICLVEAEKTAVIASFFYPQFLFLSMGSSNGLTDEKIPVLFNKKIYLLVDADKPGRETTAIKKLASYKLDFEVIDLFPDRQEGYDLADAIIDGLFPEIVPPEIVDDPEKDVDLGFEMTFEYVRKHTEPSVLFNNQTILNPGEIGVSVALPGAGKTSKVEIMAVAFIAAKNKLNIQTGGIKIVTGNRKGLLADTERPNDDNSVSFERIGRRLNIDDNVSLVQNNKFKDLDYRIFTEISTLDKRKAALEKLLATDQYEFVLLDGVLDFSAGLNDEKASLEAVTWLRSLASKHDCTIWVTLHPNKGTENMAGHLGAFLYRFCRACLMIRPHQSDKRVKEITVDFPQGKLSHSDPTSFESLYFKWDESLKMMMPCEKPNDSIITTYDLSVIQEIFRINLLKGIIKVPSSVLKKEYGHRLQLKDSAVKNHISEAVSEGVLSPEGKSKSTKYVLSDSINNNTAIE